MYRSSRAVLLPKGFSRSIRAYLIVVLTLFSFSVSASYSLDPTNIDFGVVSPNVTYSRTVDMTFGTTDFMYTVIESISVSNGFTVSHNCSLNTELSSGSCTITVRYSSGPSAPRTGTLTISGTTPESAGFGAPPGTFTSSIPLSATLKGYLTTNDWPLSFGTVLLGSSSTRQIHLTNRGDLPVPISSISVASGSDYFSSTHDCGGSVAAGDSCTVDVTFLVTDNTIGSHQGNINIVASGYLTIELYATSVAPIFEITSESLDFGGVNVGSTSATQQITANNFSNISSLDISITGPFSESNDCATAISSSNASCSILVSATPDAAGSQSGTMVFTATSSDNQTLVRSVPLTVMGLAADLVLSTTQLTFANTLVNTRSSPQSVTLTNQGNATLSINSIASSGDFSQSGDCPDALLADESCTLQVVFTPQQEGNLSGAISVESNLGTTAIELNGTANATPTAGTADLVVSNTDLTFANTDVDTTSEPQTLTLTNQGDVDLTINEISLDGDFVLTNNCGTQIIAGESCDLQIEFAPQQEGEASGSLIIDSDLGVTTVSLSGSTPATGDLPVDPPADNTDPDMAELVFSVSELSFSDAPIDATSQPQTLILTNPGSVSVTINSVTIEGDFLLTDQCGSELAAGASCSLLVSFTPKSTGTSNGTLTLDTSQGISRILLSGTAQAVPGSPIDNSEEIVELLGPFTGGNPNVAATAAAIADSCPSGRIGDRMQLDCNAVINAAVDGDANTSTALLEITPESTGKANNVSRQGGATQVRNLGSRISALRAGARGISFNGLDWQINGDNLSIAWLEEAYRSTRHQGGGASADNPLLDSKLGIFLTGTLSSGSKDETRLESGLDFDTYGLTLGADYRISDQFILGGAFGYADTQADLNNNAGKLDTQGYSLSLYGTYYSTGDYFLDFSVTYGNNDFDQKRQVAYELNGLAQVSQEFNADYNGDTASLFIGSGYDFNRAGWSFGPRFDLEYIRSSVDEFSETSSSSGASGAGWATRVEAMDQTWLTLNLGGKVSYAYSADWGVLIPYLRLDWLHEFKDDSQTITAHFVDDPEGQAIEITTDDPDRDYMRLRLGTSTQWPNGLTGFVDFGTLMAHSQWNSYDINLGLRMAF